MHFTLLIYAPEQICLPHSYLCHTALKLQPTCRPHLTPHRTQKPPPTLTFLYYATIIYVPTRKMSRVKAEGPVSEFYP